MICRMRERAAIGAIIATLLVAVGCGGARFASEEVGAGAADAGQGADPTDGADSGSELDAVSETDAGMDAVPNGDECAKVPWFRDDDGDEYGGDVSVTSCEPPAGGGTWTTIGGDCDDGNADVHPEQTAYFVEPYRVTIDGSQRWSYDYDCDGAETGAEQAGKTSKNNDCNGGALLGLGCPDRGNGYLPVNSARTGVVNSYCGSTTLLVCISNLLNCDSGVAPASAPYLCH